MSKKQAKKKKTLLRVVTLIMGLGFVGSTLAIALSSVFSSNSYHAGVEPSEDAPSVEEQIAMQVRGYEKVLEREPENLTALQGLAQIHLQTRNTEEAIAVIEQLVEYYPEQPEYAGILQILKQQQATPEAEPVEPAAEPETK